MKSKITIVGTLALFALSSCNIDPKDVVKLPETSTVKVEVVQPAAEITIVDKEFTQTHVIDLLKDPKYMQYADKIKSIKLNGVNYTVSSYTEDALVKGGDVNIQLGNQVAEKNVHADFLSDFTVMPRKVYTFNNKEKIAVAQATLDKDKKITITAKVVLPVAPAKPLKIGFAFKLDVDLDIDLAGIK